jgi:hypothetical protein
MSYLTPVIYGHNLVIGEGVMLTTGDIGRTIPEGVSFYSRCGVMEVG